MLVLHEHHLVFVLLGICSRSLKLSPDSGLLHHLVHLGITGAYKEDLKHGQEQKTV
jgi:hypothetical protein